MSKLIKNLAKRFFDVSEEGRHYSIGVKTTISQQDVETILGISLAQFTAQTNKISFTLPAKQKALKPALPRIHRVVFDKNLSYVEITNATQTHTVTCYINGLSDYRHITAHVQDGLKKINISRFQENLFVIQNAQGYLQSLSSSIHDCPHDRDKATQDLIELFAEKGISFSDMTGKSPSKGTAPYGVTSGPQ